MQPVTVGLGPKRPAVKAVEIVRGARYKSTMMNKDAPTTIPDSDLIAGNESAGQPAQDTAGAATRTPSTRPPDPTRYGDWEKAGRCIDF